MSKNLFWGGLKQIEELIHQFSDAVGDCLTCSFEALQLYLKEGETSQVVSACETSHKMESAADKIRREIIDLLLSGSMLPNARADMMNLLECMDNIADDAEDLVDFLILPHLEMEKLNQVLLGQMLEKITEQYNVLKEAVKALFEDSSLLLQLTRELEEIDSDVDKMEKQLIHELADIKSFTLSEKVIYRDFVKRIADISNTIENAGDQLEVVVAVRQG